MITSTSEPKTKAETKVMTTLREVSFRARDEQSATHAPTKSAAAIARCGLTICAGQSVRGRLFADGEVRTSFNCRRKPMRKPVPAIETRRPMTKRMANSAVCPICRRRERTSRAGTNGADDEEHRADDGDDEASCATTVRPECGVSACR